MGNGVVINFKFLVDSPVLKLFLYRILPRTPPLPLSCPVLFDLFFIFGLRPVLYHAALSRLHYSGREVHTVSNVG